MPMLPLSKTVKILLDVAIWKSALAGSVEVEIRRPPFGATESMGSPVEDEMVRRFPVWFVTPMILSVALATCVPWIKTSEVEVELEPNPIAPETERLVLDTVWNEDVAVTVKRPVEVAKVKLGLDETVEDEVKKAIWVEVPVPTAGVATVQFTSVGAQVGFRISPGL